jgi:Tol biopolymer transport system component
MLAILLSFSCKDNNPIVSPEEHFEAGPILFISDKSGTMQLYSMNEDGTYVQQLTNDPNFSISDAKWSPDSRKIAVVSPVGDEMIYPSFRDAIFIMDMDGMNRFQLTKQWFFVDDSTWGKLEYGGASNPVWSPDSKRIIYSRLMGSEALANVDIFLINIDGTNENRIIGIKNLSEEVHDWSMNTASLWGSVTGYPATDSSGHAIQYTTLTVFDLQGKVLKSWGKPNESWEWPVLSLNDDRVAFIHVDINYNFDVYLMNSDGTGHLNLTNGIYQYPRPVSWSLDGSRILLNASNRNIEGKITYRILMINSDGTNVKDITPFSNYDNIQTYATSWRRR